VGWYFDWLEAKYEADILAMISEYSTHRAFLVKLAQVYLQEKGDKMQTHNFTKMAQTKCNKMNVLFCLS
jgi:hypothetical protein